MKNELFEQNLRKKLLTFEKEPPAELWTKIEAELNEHPKNRTFVWKRYSAIAALILLLLGSTFFMFNHNDNVLSPNSPILSEQYYSNQQEILPAQTIPLKKEDAEQLPTSSKTIKKQYAQPPSVFGLIKRESEVKSDSSAPNRLTILPAKELTKDTSEHQVSIENAISIDQKDRQEAMNKFLTDGEQTQMADQRAQARENKHFALGLIAKGTPAINLDGLTNGSNAFSNRATANLPNANSSNEIPSKANHMMPLSVGVTVQKELGHRFSLETGLIYTYLYSNFEETLEPIMKKRQQSLHYLGIPLALKYEFLTSNKFYLFAKIGAMLEGNIYGEIRESVIYPFKKFIETNRIRDEKLQTSIFLSPGIAYEITRNIHIGLEPSIQYNIPNGSNLQTIRTDQPLAFNLRLGISYNFNHSK